MCFEVVFRADNPHTQTKITDIITVDYPNVDLDNLWL
jgi:hypothetical protein